MTLPGKGRTESVQVIMLCHIIVMACIVMAYIVMALPEKGRTESVQVAIITIRQIANGVHCVGLIDL